MKIKRTLDDQAKVFALASNKKYSSIFRLSVKLDENIEECVLQRAVELALDKFQAYKVKMKKGLFWYYFIGNNQKPIVKKEETINFEKVNTIKNNNYLFRVTYLDNKINMDMFHVLTDGSGATLFLKEIIYRYLELKHPEQLETSKLIENDIIYDSENAYRKNYVKHSKKLYKIKKAFMIHGERLKKGNVGINKYNVNLPVLKECVQIQNCTISTYIAAMIAYSIYEGNYKTNGSKRPINLCIPISLQKHFPSETISNFFSYMILTLKFKKDFNYTFENILEMVKQEVEKKNKKERIIETMSNDAGMTCHPLVTIVPLAIKRLVVRLGSLKVKRKFTMTISNIGKFSVSEKYSGFVKDASVTLSPDWAEKIKCGICSYGDNLCICFGTLLKESDVEKKFAELLEKQKITYYLEKSISYLPS